MVAAVSNRKMFDIIKIAEKNIKAKKKRIEKSVQEEEFFGSLGRVTYTYDVLACLWSW